MSNFKCNHKLSLISNGNEHNFRLLLEKVDKESAAEVKKMRSTPAGKFVLRMYEDYRYAKL